MQTNDARAVGRPRSLPDDARAGGNASCARPHSAAHGDVDQGALAGLLLQSIRRDVDVADLARDITRAARQVLGADLAYVMKLEPGGKSLRLKTADGAAEEEVGRLTVPVGSRPGTGYVSQAGFTMITDEPVVVDDLDAVGHFEGCELLKRYGMRSGITVHVASDDLDYGILGVHTREPRDWTGEEACWLAEVGEGLGAAAERRADARRSVASRNAVAEATAEEAAAEEAVSWRRRIAAIKRTMTVLAAAQDPLRSLEAAASLAVRGTAEWCFVDLLEAGGLSGPGYGDTIRRVVVRSAGGESDDLARELARAYSYDPAVPLGTPAALLTGRPQLARTLTSEDLEAVAHDGRYLRVIERLAPSSCVTVPLSVRGNAVGALVLVTTGGRRLAERDLEFADDLALCVSCVLHGSLAELSGPGREAAAIQDLASSRPSIEPRPLAEPEAEALAADLADARDPRAPESRLLTYRQRRVLVYYREYASAKEVAKQLHLSHHTVESHLGRIRQIFGVPSTIKAIAEAERRREIPPPGSGLKLH